LALNGETYVVRVNEFSAMCNWQVVGVQVEQNRCKDRALRKAVEAPLKALDEKLLSDRASVAARWQKHFRTLLNQPTQSPLMLWYLKHRHPRQIPPLIPPSYDH